MTTPSDPKTVAAVLHLLHETVGSVVLDIGSSHPAYSALEMLAGRLYHEATSLERAGTEGGKAKGYVSCTVCGDADHDRPSCNSPICPNKPTPTAGTEGAAKCDHEGPWALQDSGELLCRKCGKPVKEPTPTAPSAPHQWAWVKGKGYQACSVCTLIRLPSGRYDNEECDGRPPTDDKPAPSAPAPRKWKCGCFGNYERCPVHNEPEAPAPWDAHRFIVNWCMDNPDSTKHEGFHFGEVEKLVIAAHAAGVGARVPLPDCSIELATLDGALGEGANTRYAGCNYCNAHWGLTDEQKERGKSAIAALRTKLGGAT